jgi:phosphate transport system substrate-binding protein
VAGELAKTFHEKNPDIKVQVEGGGSTAGIQALADGIADIGTCSRSLSDEEAKKYKGIPIAYDGLAIVVHPDNPVEKLTTEQIQGLFSGQIGNWKDVGGKDAKVTVVVREEGSGTRESFTKLVMEHNKSKAEPRKDAIGTGSNGQVSETVSHDPNAIGYMSLGLVGKGLSAVQVDGAAATVAEIKTGKYRLVRPFLFVVHKDKPLRDEAQKFLDFVLSPDGQAVLVKDGDIARENAPGSATKQE